MCTFILCRYIRLFLHAWHRFGFFNPTFQKSLDYLNIYIEMRLHEFLDPILHSDSNWSILSNNKYNPGQPIQKPGFWLSSRPLCRRTTFIWVHQGPTVIVLVFFWNSRILKYGVKTQFCQSSWNLVDQNKDCFYLYRRAYWITRTPAFVWVCLDCICWTISTNWDHCVLLRIEKGKKAHSKFN